ncbi:histidinol dehydrogenase [Pseudofulvibacter geojedonensis]|uniref:Histidinol dehydrogenase n=1 Tax=Pseudofulvibacter geojedonensis TaxID=1123758 RepID=A0ABW3I366_9FLAO
MNKVINPKRDSWSDLLKRPTQSVEDIEQTVEQIFSEVKTKGDLALKKYTNFFDGIKIDELEVSETEISAAVLKVSEDLQEAIKLAKNNIELFHSAQSTGKIVKETIEGVSCWQEKKPINKVGLYIPGGSAPLFSTVLMLAVPAKVAGCKEIILCTPPDKEGNVNPAILYTAQLCGVTKIFKVGGIQAIAGLTFGTETIPKVYKIFGPGNQFVTVAKQLATKYEVAIDMPAGPSELLVYADETAIPSFVASDLLSQAEHGADSQVILVSPSETIIAIVEKELTQQLAELPRKEIATKAIENSKLILVEDITNAIELINEYGPEHFIICSDNEQYFIENIENAGSVFIGNYTPESAGDYASGTNHTLPTNGFAKSYSGVNLDSFLKSMTFQKITKQGIQKIGNAIELMAEAEGLQAHKNAVSLRLKEIENELR